MAVRKQAKPAAKKRKYSPRSKPSVKKPGPQLEKLIELASLVPPGVELPPELMLSDVKFRMLRKPNTPEDLTTAISQLPEGAMALQNHLHVLMNQPEEWPLDYRAEAGPRANQLLLERTKWACQANAVRSRYGLIRNANEALRRIADQNVVGSFFEVLVPTELLIRMDSMTGKSKAFYDPIYAALLGESLDYIKTCPRCEQLFFAPRVNSTACERCREAYRKKKQRAK